MVIDIQGRCDGRAKRVVVRRRYKDDPETARHLAETLGTVSVGVASAAIAGARMIAAGKMLTGVMPVEALEPLVYLAEVNAIMPLEVELEVTAPLVL